MSNPSEVWIVEDDKALSESLELLFASSRAATPRVFKTASDFLQALADQPSPPCGCILMDIRLPDGNGHALFETLLQHNWTWPVIFMTGHGDLEMALMLMRKGAFDYMLKPYDPQALLDRVKAAIESCQQAYQQTVFVKQYDERLQTLTPHEVAVYKGILSHKTSRELAEEMSNSTRTIEIHRANVFKKMHATSAVEMAQNHERYQLIKTLKPKVSS
jgi:FixJ family two-component response regulator